MADRNEEEEEGRERIVVLLRHGIAEEKSAGRSDEERALTAEGHARMMVIAKGLAKAFPRAQAIWSSPLVRAMQTALWVSKAFRSRVKVQSTAALVPGATPADLTAFLAGLSERRIILVGHEPNLSTNVAAFTAMGADANLDFRKGGACAIRFHGAGSEATLDWLLTPRILRKLGE